MTASLHGSRWLQSFARTAADLSADAVTRRFVRRCFKYRVTSVSTLCTVRPPSPIERSPAVFFEAPLRNAAGSRSSTRLSISRSMLRSNFLRYAMLPNLHESPAGVRIVFHGGFLFAAPPQQDDKAKKDAEDKDEKTKNGWTGVLCRPTFLQKNAHLWKRPRLQFQVPSKNTLYPQKNTSPHISSEKNPKQMS